MILLTGATGYIGAHVLRAFIGAGEKTAVFVRPQSVDQIDPEFAGSPRLLTTAPHEEILQFFQTHRIRAVVHLAAAFPSGAGEQSPRLIEANLLLGSRLLEAMAAVGCRNFINTGTFSQHGSGAAFEPKTLYDATKQAFEDLLEYYVQAHGFRVVTLKLFDVYGPHDPRPKILELLSMAAASGKSLAVTKGEQLVNMVHVEDVAQAYLTALRSLGPGPGDH
jgi:nucleoside-diphosphate-sugar epimerase